MINKLFRENKRALKWIGLAFLIKIPIFIFFAVQFNQHWPQDRIINNIFIESGDTYGYYDPLENLAQGKGYTTICRMPGLAPIYFCLRLLFNQIWAKSFIILLQFIISTISIYVLARISKMLFKTELAFRITFFLYAFSTFVSIWDHFGYADSFATSFLIFSVYLLLKFKETGKMIQLLLAGIFIAWSVFHRPVHGYLVPLLSLLYLFDHRILKQSVKKIFVFSFPLAFFLFVWTFKNFRDTKTIVVLQGPMHTCFPGISEDLLAINKIIIAWGGDIQPWAKSSAGQWFFECKSIAKPIELLEKDDLPSNFTLDSLHNIKSAYTKIHSDSIPFEEKKILTSYVIRSANLFEESYKKEKPFRYYVLNKLRLMKLLVFRERLDNLPFPKLTDMSVYHKIIKGGYFILLLFINFFGLIGCFLVLHKKIHLAWLPITFILLLGVVFGYAEQRYLVPVYPFLLIFTAYLLGTIISRFKKSNEAPD